MAIPHRSDTVWFRAGFCSPSLFDMNSRLLWLTLFAVAMAIVEAAIVVHLRSVYYPDDPLAIFPLSILSTRDLFIELAREAATVVMILSVALLSERGFIRVFAAFLYMFGVWDVFYYVWLKAMIGWPVAWLEWDVLFLIPWPWLGPWLAPVMIALLFVAWGGKVLASTNEIRLTAGPALLFVAGSLISLASFLMPAISLLSGGPEAFVGFTPGGFRWGPFFAGFLLMAVGLMYVNGNSD